MREIQASEAKARLGELLTAVERGETILITRHGRSIARLVPEADVRSGEIERAVDDLLNFHARLSKKAPLTELLGARHAGHKY
ncbi:type II toxin-antitoxin system prevent-host-death family antitoxin [Methylocystis sp. Sn-Cys]|nr:type II toxin-antitoxin system prevent-host-death family antitoxin [Methylocystis sp. Sn-Cys]